MSQTKELCVCVRACVSIDHVAPSDHALPEGRGTADTSIDWHVRMLRL
jgi:hypothetical protein